MAGFGHVGVMVRVSEAISRRAVAIAALECGATRTDAAARAGISRRTLNRYLQPTWEPGA